MPSLPDSIASCVWSGGMIDRSPYSMCTWVRSVRIASVAPSAARVRCPDN
jgi:hypothetical protein